MALEQGLVGVTGVTGGIGGRVAVRLAERGHAHRFIARDPARAPRLSGAEVAPLPASYDDPAAMRRALDGVRTLFFVSAHEAPDRVRQHIAVVDAALAAGVARIVYLSFLAAAPNATFTFARDHFRTEEYIHAAGVAHTFLRPSLYLDLVPSLCWSDGTILGPAGDGRVAWIARDDVAAVATAVLVDETDGHDGRTYDVTGLDALTLSETAAELSSATGRHITYRSETLEEARASRASSGVPAWEIEGWVTSYAAIATGEMAVVSDAVARLAGHQPQSLPDYLRRHPESVAHLIAP